MTTTLAGGKAYFIGTHRIRPPEQTWSVIEPLLERFGITRIADVTGLDGIGIPVAIAVRPLGRTLSVSQGKGLTFLLARVSAAMEAIELWHAENAPVRSSHRAVAPRELNLPYRFADLPTVADSLLGERSRLDWVAAKGLVTGHTVPVPRDLVMLRDQPPQMRPPFVLPWNSNGLASGNNLAEASLHALYEIVERDALSRRSRPEHVAPDSITEAANSDLIDRFRAAGCQLHILHVPGRFGIPCFLVHLWSEDFPVTCMGSGAHLDPAVALSRALTEAAQSRLTAIAGSRDDLPPIYERVRLAAEERPDTPPTFHDWAELAPAWAVDQFDRVDLELAWLAALIQQRTGAQPLAVRLDQEQELAVVKVTVPGLHYDHGRIHSR